MSDRHPVEITTTYSSIVVSLGHVNLLLSHFVHLLCSTLWKTLEI